MELNAILPKPLWRSRHPILKYIFFYVLVRKTKWISKNNIEGLNVFPVCVILFLDWNVEWKRSSFSPASSAHQGLSRAQGIIISVNADHFLGGQITLSLHSRNGRKCAIYRWFSLVCWLKSSQSINKIIAQTTSLIRKWDLHPGTRAEVKTSVLFITLSVTWNLDPRGKLDLHLWIKGHNLLSSS